MSTGISARARKRLRSLDGLPNRPGHFPEASVASRARRRIPHPPIKTHGRPIRWGHMKPDGRRVPASEVAICTLVKQWSEADAAELRCQVKKIHIPAAQSVRDLEFELPDTATLQKCQKKSLGELVHLGSKPSQITVAALKWCIRPEGGDARINLVPDRQLRVPERIDGPISEPGRRELHGFTSLSRGPPNRNPDSRDLAQHSIAADDRRASRVRPRK